MGSLPDVTTLEIQQDLNGEFELYMEYPVDGLHADDITVERIIYTKPDDLSSSQPFRIYDVEEELDGYKYTIYAHHIGYDLSDYPVEPFSTTGVLPALIGLVSHSMVSHSFTVWTDITNTETAFSLEEPRSFRACIGGVQGSILDRFGGELEWDGFTVERTYRGCHLTIEATNPEHVQHGIKEIRIDGEKVDLKNGPLLTESFLNGRSKACVQVTMGI